MSDTPRTSAQKSTFVDVLTALAADPAAGRAARWSLAAANVVPLAGVLFFSWDVGLILLTYWAENVVVGLVTLARILIAGRLAAVPLALFFTIHYGIFTIVHGVFVVVLPQLGSVFNGRGSAVPDLRPELSSLVLPVAALAVSHLIALVGDIADPARRPADAKAEMARPYGRVVVLHLALLGGAFLTLALGQPAMLLALLVVLKTAFDLRIGPAEASRLLKPR